MSAVFSGLALSVTESPWLRLSRDVDGDKHRYPHGCGVCFRVWCLSVTESPRLSVDSDVFGDEHGYLRGCCICFRTRFVCN